jgi:nucleotidyltransferase/DNA polymerase involved in DNA repair
VDNALKSGPYFYWIARGVEERDVKPDWVLKSVGAENSSPENIHDLETARAGLHWSTRSDATAKPKTSEARRSR